MKKLFILGIFFAGLGFVLLGYLYSGSFRFASDSVSKTAAIFFKESINQFDLQGKYRSFPKDRLPIKVLIVPGHEPDYGGAVFGSLKERDLNVELADYLTQFFASDNHYEVFVARDKNAWSEALEAHFRLHHDDIVEFQKVFKIEMTLQKNKGLVEDIIPGVYHNNADPDVAVRLYGINQWANENNIDIVLHIHFNDYRRKKAFVPGMYSGFAVYVPDSQFSNSKTARVIGEKIFKKLSKYTPVSNLPGEDKGIIPDQNLIAVGAYNTVNGVSVLTEYSYIYEPELQDSSTRNVVLQDLAFGTFLGLEDFFGATQNILPRYDSVLFPHTWLRRDLSKREIFALQTALIDQEIYPPDGKTKNNCPRSGVFGPCTKEALTSFQITHGISGERGVLGTKTRTLLNLLYGS